MTVLRGRLLFLFHKWGTETWREWLAQGYKWAYGRNNKWDYYMCPNPMFNLPKHIRSPFQEY